MHWEILVKVELGVKTFLKHWGIAVFLSAVSSESAKESGGISFIHSMLQQTFISRCLMGLRTLNYWSYIYVRGQVEAGTITEELTILEGWQDAKSV